MTLTPSSQQALTTSEYISMADSAEAKRYAAMMGVGDATYDESQHDDLNDMLFDVGLGGAKE